MNTILNLLCMDKYPEKFPSWANRPYEPVNVCIKMPVKAAGQHAYGLQTFCDYGPFLEWTRTLVSSMRIGGTNYPTYLFFVKHPDYDHVCRLLPTNLLVLFEAEPFFYLMKNASRRSKLTFFRRAVIESEAEAEKFLALVEASDLSNKDKQRARTWLWQRQRNMNI